MYGNSMPSKASALVRVVSYELPFVLIARDCRDQSSDHEGVYVFSPFPQATLAALLPDLKLTIFQTDLIAMVPQVPSLQVQAVFLH